MMPEPVPGFAALAFGSKRIMRKFNVLEQFRTENRFPLFLELL
jgi:hypothetical protein